MNRLLLSLLEDLRLWRPSRVRKLFGVVLLVALCLLLLQLHYLRSSCPPGDGDCHTTEEHLQEMPSTKQAQHAQPPWHRLPRQQRVTVPVGRARYLHPSQKPTNVTGEQDVSLHNDASFPNIPHDKWIIADVTYGQCKDKINAPPGWNVLLANQAQNGNSSPLVTLPSNLGGGVRDLKTDSSQVWRKNDAYIVAIGLGAKQILDTDCSVSLAEVLQMMQVHDHKDHGLVYNDTLLFNSYAHFGAWALAPRAAALHPGLWNNSGLYYVRDFNNRVFIKHAVSDQSEDAAVVLRRGDGGGDDVGARFDPSSPPVYLNQRSFSPAVPGCSVYRQEAFWALLDPCLPSSLHCRVLRLFLQQRLLRELDAYSGYYQLGRSSTGASVSKEKEEDLHQAGEASLVNIATFLNDWKCEEEVQFYQCFISLVDRLQGKGYLTKDQSQTMMWFISALKVIGTVEPVRIKTPWRRVRRIGEFRVKLGSVRTTLECEGIVKEKSLRRRLVEPVAQRCRGTSSGGYFVPVSQWKNPVIEDVVLIVVFNKNMYFWRNIGFLETTYRPYFKHIAYCVTDVDSLLKEDDSGLLNHITVVEGLTTYWYLMYGCTTVLMQMNLQGVRGYLQIGDDTLLNPWSLFNTSHDVIFMHNFGMKINAHHFHVKPHWKWWSSPQGRCPLLNVMSELEEISGVPKQRLLAWAGIPADLPVKQRRHTFSEIREGDKQGRQPPVTHCDTLPGTEVWSKPNRQQAERFLYNYYNTHNMSGYFVGKTQDFFYLPQSMAEDYVDMSHLFMRNRVIVELALHAIQLGIAGRSDIQTVPGSSLWHENRHKTRSFFNASHFYLHPFKTSLYTHKRHQADFFCNVYLKTLVSKLKNVRP